ncbi:MULTISPECIES: ASCH domain-containing protein [unclassified Paenibacillus]|uniref:ASCH domain-containing protein n=1 Tax=unclassified Paenibacillus TaxID=185978 RepID=UPI0024059339|nr:MULTISPECIES: ASCH domain-containing protein [unclassified Paenibacillus]MDF9844168.1 hypothetical protein [Paenibacillus sp. PastF-2]MDF9850710.1 hypothetical protein [Paenibacillus sp. PastM-2]MDF9857281.1 hypothetical protein [Paenibacillus sp. PastF-1]MDH6482611.1 hypothetical protein [Paenibacillus sp. PastH-2]MDH6510038.1 hypothetical protein [Paenibacillus sp. PastM-3]
MKAITIKQPWATLIALGEKHLETRSWQTKHRGELAIHAGKQVDAEACEIPKIKEVLARHGYTVNNLPTGAVVATTTLIDCHKVTLMKKGKAVVSGIGYVEGNELAFGWYDEGRYAWQLGGIKQLPQPIPAKGLLSLWNWEGAKANVD